MSILKDNIDLILPIIACLSFLSLISGRPSRSAIILLLQAILVDIYLGVTHGIASTVFGVSIMLTFFSLIVLGSNYYLELSFIKTASKPPKLNILIAIFLTVVFWRYIKDLFADGSSADRLYFLNLNYDGLSLVIAGFALFAILVSSLLIFDLKNQKSGDPS